MFAQILVEFAALVGFAALVSVIINILKVAGVVKDGTADKWSAGFNLAGVLALLIIKQFWPELQLQPIDNALYEAASVLSYILSYVAMLLGSKVTYIAVKGLPLIGKSNSDSGAG